MRPPALSTARWCRLHLMNAAGVSFEAALRHRWLGSWMATAVGGTAGSAERSPNSLLRLRRAGAIPTLRRLRRAPRTALPRWRIEPFPVASSPPLRPWPLGTRRSAPLDGHSAGSPSSLRRHLPAAARQDPPRWWRPAPRNRPFPRASFRDRSGSTVIRVVLMSPTSFPWHLEGAASRLTRGRHFALDAGGRDATLPGRTSSGSPALPGSTRRSRRSSPLVDPRRLSAARPASGCDTPC